MNSLWQVWLAILRPLIAGRLWHILGPRICSDRTKERKIRLREKKRDIEWYKLKIPSLPTLAHGRLLANPSSNQVNNLAEIQSLNQTISQKEINPLIPSASAWQPFRMVSGTKTNLQFTQETIGNIYQRSTTRTLTTNSLIITPPSPYLKKAF